MADAADASARFLNALVLHATIGAEVTDDTVRNRVAMQLSAKMPTALIDRVKNLTVEKSPYREDVRVRTTFKNNCVARFWLKNLTDPAVLAKLALAGTAGDREKLQPVLDVDE